VEIDELSSDTSLPRILVGNKADLVDRREVEYKTAAEFTVLLTKILEFVYMNVCSRLETQELVNHFFLTNSWTTPAPTTSSPPSELTSRLEKQQLSTRRSRSRSGTQVTTNIIP
jgi:GTPase SAR1 family protein